MNITQHNEPQKEGTQQVDLQLSTGKTVPASAPQPMGLNVAEQQLAEAQTLVDSRILPDSITTAQAAVVIMQYGRELGFPPMASFQNIFVVNGKPSISTKAASGLLYKGGIRWRVLQDCEPVMGKDAQGNDIATDSVTTIEMTREGIVHKFSFYWSDAVRANLVKNKVWTKHPKNMMYWRCLSMLADRVAPDLLLGLPDAATMGDVHGVSYTQGEDGSFELNEQQ